MGTLQPAKYGKVIGRLLAVVADGPDEDEYPTAGGFPDAKPLAGSVTFTPRTSTILVAGASPAPVTAIAHAVTAQLDENGYLTLNGKRGVFLLCPSAETNPATFTYSVRYNLNLDGRVVSAPTFDIELEEYVPGPDLANPDVGSTAIDLTLVTPAQPSGGTPTVRGPKGDSVTAIAVSEDGGSLVFTVAKETGPVVTTVPVPALPLMSDAESFAAIAGAGATTATDKAEEAAASATAAAASAVEASQYVGGVADGTISTPKIIDGAVILSKLSAAIQASLAKADTAAQPSDVSAAVNAVVGAAPGVLDTLDELANALGDDPNFATTITTALAGKAADADVVKLAGAQTVTGAKNYTGGLSINGQSAVATNDPRLADTRTPTSGTQFYDTTLPGAGDTTTRAVGYNDCALGMKLQRPVTFSKVTFRCLTADASGSLVVELRKNGVAVAGTSVTIAAASQTAGASATGSWSFAEGDVLTVYVTSVGGTPGKGLIADLKGLA